MTDNAAGIQDFGCTGAENAIFYKLELDPSATLLSISFNGGSATNISVATFSLSSTEYGGGTAYGGSLYTDASGNDLLSCDLIGQSPVRFDLCDFTPADFDNLYLWISTPAANEGTFNIDISQYIPPPNDECNNATDISQMSGRGEQCHSFFNFGACSDMINYTTRPHDMNDVPCLINDPADPSTAGVWLQFTTDANAALLNLYFHHENNQQLTVGLYAGDPDCTNLLPLDCWTDDGDGVIDGIENYEINLDTAYYLYIYTNKFISGAGEMCIDSNLPFLVKRLRRNITLQLFHSVTCLSSISSALKWRQNRVTGHNPGHNVATGEI